MLSNSPEETRAFAAILARSFVPSDLVTLKGDLGAGKTLFVSAVAAALNVPREAGVRSPSYTMMNVYEGGEFPIAHLDLYRIEGADELEALGFRDLLEGSDIVMVEWPERVPEVEALATWQLEFLERGIEAREIRVRSSRQPALESLRQHLGVG
jgi:tRNA threonylcarbamoyladenosine biosynthesis protein TsaE